MTHGLGFLGLVNLDATQGPVGAEAGITTDATGNLTIGFTDLSEGPYDDIYDANIAIVSDSGTTYTPFMGYETNGSGDAARAAAVVSGPTITQGHYFPGVKTGIRWSDPVAVNASINALFGKRYRTIFRACMRHATRRRPQPAQRSRHPRFRTRSSPAT